MATLSKNGILAFSRGDTVSFPLFINAGTKTSPMRYILHDDENLYVGIMEPNMAFEAAIIKQRYTVDDLDENGDVVFKLNYKDTQLLRPGKYYYEAKLAKLDENDEITSITTVIPRTQLYVEGGDMLAAPYSDSSQGGGGEPSEGVTPEEAREIAEEVVQEAISELPEVPMPSITDAGKAIVVGDDGNYLLANVGGGGGSGLESRTYNIRYFNNEYIRILSIPENNNINKANVYVNVNVFVKDDENKVNKILTSTNSFEISYGKSQDEDIFSHINVLTDYPSDLLTYGSGSGSGSKKPLPDVGGGGSGGSGSANDQLKALVIENDNGSIYVNGLFTATQMEEVYDHSEIEIAIEKISGEINFLDEIYVNHGFTKNHVIQINEGETLDGPYRFDVTGTLDNFLDAIESGDSHSISITKETTDSPTYMTCLKRNTLKDMPNYYAYDFASGYNTIIVYTSDDTLTDSSVFYSYNNNQFEEVKLPFVIDSNTILRQYGNGFAYLSFNGELNVSNFLRPSVWSNDNGFYFSNFGNGKDFTTNLRIEKTESSPIDSIIYVSNDNGQTIKPLSEILTEDLNRYSSYYYYLNERVKKINLLVYYPWGPSTVPYIRDEAKDESNYYAYKSAQSPVDGYTTLYLNTDTLEEGQTYNVYKKTGDNEFVQFEVYNVNVVASLAGEAYLSLNIQTYCNEHGIEYSPLIFDIDAQNTNVALTSYKDYEDFVINDYTNELGEYDISTIAYKNSKVEEVQLMYSAQKTLEYLTERVSTTIAESNNIRLTSKSIPTLDIRNLIKESIPELSNSWQFNSTFVTSYGNTFYEYACIYDNIRQKQRDVVFSYNADSKEFKLVELDITNVLVKQIAYCNDFIVIRGVWHAEGATIITMNTDLTGIQSTQVLSALNWGSIGDIINLDTSNNIFFREADTELPAVIKTNLSDTSTYSVHSILPSDWADTSTIKGSKITCFENEMYLLIWSTEKLDAYNIVKSGDSLLTSKLNTSANFINSINPMEVAVGFTYSIMNIGIVDSNYHAYIFKLARSSAGSGIDMPSYLIFQHLGEVYQYSENKIFAFSYPITYFLSAPGVYEERAWIYPVIGFNTRSWTTNFVIRAGSRISSDTISSEYEAGLLFAGSYKGEGLALPLLRYKDYFIYSAVYRNSYVNNGEVVPYIDGYTPITNDKKVYNLPLSIFFETSASATDIDWHFTVTYEASTKTLKIN